MSDETRGQLSSSPTMDEAYEAHAWGTDVLTVRNTLTQDEWAEIQRRIRALSEDYDPDGNVVQEYQDLATLTRIHWKLFQTVAQKLVELEREIARFVKKRPGASEESRLDDEACLRLLGDLVTMTTDKLDEMCSASEALASDDTE